MLGCCYLEYEAEQVAAPAAYVRVFTSSCLLALCLCAQAKDGQDVVKEFGASKALKLGNLLQGNTEFESHLEAADEYMKRQSLGFIVIS